MSNRIGTDCFPSHVIRDPEKWTFYNLNAKDLMEPFHAQSQAFISWIPQADNPHEKFYYHFTPKTKEIAKHEEWCLKKSENTCDMLRMVWDQVHKKHSQPIRTNVKNSDQRMHFRYLSVFLCKYSFSFGLRTVPENHYHVYQTGKNPIYLYKQTKSMPKNIQTVQRSFKVEHRNYFTKFVMEPDSLYYIPPETTYVLLTCQKTLFAVDVVRKSVMQKLRERYEFQLVTAKRYSPHGRKRKYDELDVNYAPPATPAMDQLHDFYTQPDCEVEEEEEKMPANYTPDAESFFDSSSTSKRKKKPSPPELVDSEGFKLPIIPPLKTTKLSKDISAETTETSVPETSVPEQNEIPEISVPEQNELSETSIPEQNEILYVVEPETVTEPISTFQPIAYSEPRQPQRYYTVEPQIQQQQQYYTVEPQPQPQQQQYYTVEPPIQPQQPFISTFEPTVYSEPQQQQQQYFHLDPNSYYAYPRETFSTASTPDIDSSTVPEVSNSVDDLFKSDNYFDYDCLEEFTLPRQLPSDEELLKAIEDVLGGPNPETFFTPALDNSTRNDRFVDDTNVRFNDPPHTRFYNTEQVYRPPTELPLDLLEDIFS